MSTKKPNREKGDKSDDQPQLYAVKREKGRFTLSRREFISASAAAAVAAAALRSKVGHGAQGAGAEIPSGALLLRDEEELPASTVGLRAHSKPIRCLAFSPDGTHLYSGGDDDVIKTWSLSWLAQEGSASVLHAEFLATLAGHTGSVYSLAFCDAEGSKIASGGDDDTVRIWTLDDGTAVVLEGNAGDVNQIAASPDGSLLASAHDDGKIRLWSLPDQSLVATLGDAEAGHSGSVMCLAFSSDGQQLASGGADNTVRIWDIDATRQTYYGYRGKHTESVLSVAFLSDNSVLASAGADGRIVLWGFPSGREDLLFNRELAAHEGDVNSLAVLQDAAQLVSCGDDRLVNLWSIADGSLVASLKGHKDDVTCVAVSPDGSLLATADENGCILLWDLPGLNRRWLLFESAVCVNAKVLSCQYEEPRFDGEICVCNTVCTCNTVLLPHGTTVSPPSRADSIDIGLRPSDTIYNHIVYNHTVYSHTVYSHPIIYYH